MSRPQNIGIKAIEIYFPAQVCGNITGISPRISAEDTNWKFYSVSPRQSLRSSMAFPRENTQLVSAKPR